MDGFIDWMDGRLDGWMDEWMNGWMDGWMDQRTFEWMYGWMDQRRVELMDGWMEGLMDEWMVKPLPDPFSLTTALNKLWKLISQQLDDVTMTTWPSNHPQSVHLEMRHLAPNHTFTTSQGPPSHEEFGHQLGRLIPRSPIVGYALPPPLPSSHPPTPVVIITITTMSWLDSNDRAT